MSPCTICGEEVKLIPAGISKKTGKPYSAFWSCPNRHIQNMPAPKAIKPVVQTSKEPDWEAISRGKVRHGLVCAMIEANWDGTRIKSELPFYVQLVMNDSELEIEEIELEDAF